jgi:hypothetical protein
MVKTTRHTLQAKKPHAHHTKTCITSLANKSTEKVFLKTSSWDLPRGSGVHLQWGRLCEGPVINSLKDAKKESTDSF